VQIRSAAARHPVAAAGSQMAENQSRRGQLHDQHSVRLHALLRPGARIISQTDTLLFCWASEIAFLYFPSFFFLN
jgi:hypothetical protein